MGTENSYGRNNLAQGKKRTRKKTRSRTDKVLGALIILTLMGIAVVCGAFLGKFASDIINI